MDTPRTYTLGLIPSLTRNASISPAAKKQKLPDLQPIAIKPDQQLRHRSPIDPEYEDSKAIYDAVAAYGQPYVTTLNKLDNSLTMDIKSPSPVHTPDESPTANERMNAIPKLESPITTMSNTWDRMVAYVTAQHENGDAADGSAVNDTTLTRKNTVLSLLRRKSSRRTADSDKKRGVELSWRNLNYAIPVKGKDFKHILKDLNGAVMPGEMLAIMGGSGAGKSTLMDVLSGRARGGQATGDIRFNNFASDAIWRKSIGYVQQEDLFWETLTVRETLTYGAEMKLPEYVTKQERLDRVDKVAMQMRLSHILDSRVGDTMVRGISGGERKRLNIAMELLSEPDVMMLDEPTSGLDAYNAQIVVDLLRQAAKDGNRTILMSIHQPRREILDLFDKVLILARGEILFFGSVPESIQHFIKMGHPIPALTNPADHFLDIATFDTSSPKTLDTSSKRIGALVETWKANYEPMAFPPYKHAVEYRSKDSAEYDKPGTIFWIRRVLSLMFRQWKMYRRDRALITMGVVSSSIFLVLYGVLWSLLSVSEDGANSRLSFFFMFALNRFFTSIFGIVLKLPLRLSLYMRERAGGMYDGSMAFWALYFATFMQYLWLAFPLMTAIYFIVGLQLDIVKFAIFFSAGTLMYLSGHTYGCLFGSMTRSVSASLTYSLLLLGVFAAFSGYIVVPSAIPQPLVFIAWLNPLFLGYHIWAQNELASLTWTCLPTDIVCNASGDVILNSLSLYSVSTIAAFCMLVVVIALFATIAYVLFERSTRPAYLNGITVEVATIKKE
ncbi:hypothetical protein SmJEL517_g06179 [Synchytrium microbalum]|uniref:ABC transporter domain-containing protein n=1 Tax=Synchytrium microbalum TaxID=1806994 RepID=A0A507BS35_9FUNG|nr:uncharacterized protein SmJEL517_g06179 [Synchytrium microbalum]TPX30201.1 hypothetical protein SmJEL517_g06179 [Synchytrium microbalum]